MPEYSAAGENLFRTAICTVAGRQILPRPGIHWQVLLRFAGTGQVLERLAEIVMFDNDGRRGVRRRHHDLIAMRLQDRGVVEQTERAGIGRQRLEVARDQPVFAADVVRYVPGISVHQGENNRDQLIIRGNSTSADFFVNGVRDDVQYFRDLYNTQSLEVMKGPSALTFGRGNIIGFDEQVLIFNTLTT